MQRGEEEEEEAERLYQTILPLITFVNSGVETYLCYGKRLVASCLGLGEVHPRCPAVAPEPLGTAIVERYAAALGPLGG